MGGGGADDEGAGGGADDSLGSSLEELVVAGDGKAASDGDDGEIDPRYGDGRDEVGVEGIGQANHEGAGGDGEHLSGFVQDADLMNWTRPGTRMSGDTPAIRNWSKSMIPSLCLLWASRQLGGRRSGGLPGLRHCRRLTDKTGRTRGARPGPECTMVSQVCQVRQKKTRTPPGG